MRTRLLKLNWLRDDNSSTTKAIHMVNSRITPILFIVLFAIAPAIAPTGEISKERKRAIDSLALGKVRDMSKYIGIIGNKKTAFSEANRVMDRAEELFAPGSEMGVSSLSTKEVSYYKV